METFFTRYKNPLVLVLLLAAQFVLLAVQVRPRLPGAAAADQAGVQAIRRGVSTVVAPPEEAAHSSGMGVRGLWNDYVNLVDLKQKNEQLEAENQRLQLEQAALSEDAREGQRLETLLAFKQHYVDTTVPAQIIGTGGSDHGRVFYIDKGSNDGIQTDMPVITPNGIVGRIRDVTPGTAQVLEINDPTSAAGVVLEQTRTQGIVRGNDVGQPEIVNLMPDARIQPGELVITSGGDQIFPRGLPVGTVEKVVPDADNAPLVDVILKPSANLGRLEEVLVVTGTSNTLSPQASRDLARSRDTAAALKAAAASKAAAAAQAASDAERASDILAMRLPSATDVVDPDAPDAAAGSSPQTADVAGAPLSPPAALHPDHYSPGSAEPAADMTPGARSGPYLQGKIPTVRVNKPGEDGDALQGPQPGVSPAFLAAHNAALAASGHAPAQKPKIAPSPAQGIALTRTPAASGVEHAPAQRSYAGKSADFGVVGETRQGATRPASIHPPGTRPAATHPAATKAATSASHAAPGVTAAHRAPVQTTVITDGPLPSASKPRTTTPAPHRTGPTLVPNDGSAPPRTTPQPQ